MDEREKAKEIARMWQQIADNEGAYFEREYISSWDRAATAPSIKSDLRDWRVYVPPKKWKAKQGEFHVDRDLKAYGTWSEKYEPVMTRYNLVQTERLAEDIRKLATLSARVDELGGRKEFTHHEINWYIFFDYSDNKYLVASSLYTQRICEIHMTKECAEQICDELNSGYLEIEDDQSR